MTSQQVSILAVMILRHTTKQNICSLNSLKRIRGREGKSAYRYIRCAEWMFENGILFEDDIGQVMAQANRELVSEVIFPSRHAVMANLLDLCTPIGVPHLLKDEHPKFGGKSGYAAPPSTRSSSWWKMLQNYVEGTDLANQFELTLEVTHHGPWLEVPALFIEIGSTEETWPHEGAAELLASIISDGII